MNKLIVSLDAVARNYKTLQKQLARGAECGAVVKANGYGLGASEIAGRLAEEGCKSFFVATLEEGIELREHIKQDIYVFHGAQKTEVKTFLKHKLIPILNNPDQLETWPKDKPCGVNFENGMVRLGLPASYIKVAKDYNVKLVMSHFKNAEDKNDAVNNAQRSLFILTEHNRFPQAKRSLCNSYGIYLGKQYHFDIARPGIALYGGNPTPGKKNPMKNVVTVTAPIIQINKLKQSASVGYGWDYIAQEDETIGTIPVGYADGILRSLGNKGKVYCGKYELPIVGRISMDLITIKLNNLPPQLRKLGTMVEILGEKYTICDMAKDAGTIEYEIITRLGNRFERVYE